MNGLVPSFELHFVNGVLQGMTPEQNAFYSKLVESIEGKTYLPVADQPAYLNYYIREKYKTFDMVVKTMQAPAGATEKQLAQGSRSITTIRRR